MKAGLVEKNKYQQCVLAYIQRREEYKNQYPIKDDTYFKRMKVYEDKLRTWKRAIRRIEERDNKIAAIAKLVEEFTNVNLWDTRNQKNHKTSLIRAIFFKYGLEQGIRGSYLSDYLDLGRRVGWDNYQRFTKSFKTNPANKKLYSDFKSYVKLQK